MKWVALAALITVFLAVGGWALLTFAVRSPNASPKLFSSQELATQEANFRSTRPAEDLTVRWKPTNQDSVDRGRFLYNVNCMTCHGVNGDGVSITPEGLPIRPRDFTGKSHITQQIMFKFKSLNKTDPLALDADLKKTIKEGLPGTPMPGFSILSDQEIADLLDYIKTFGYAEWRFEQPTVPALQVPPVPQDLASQPRIDLGRALFTSAGCSACHGAIEQGGRPPVQFPTEWQDEEGKPILVWPRNFALDPLRRPDPQDIFKTVRLGIGGTAMPANLLTDEETWNLIAYVLHLRQLGSEGKVPAQ